MTVGIDRSLSLVAEPSSGVDGLHRRLVRLACDVHDGPMQYLTSAGYGINELRRRLTGTQAIAATTLSSELSQILAELAYAEKGLRTLITRLEHVDPALDRIADLVETEVRAFGERCSADVETEVHADFELDSPSQAHALRAVLRESLANVARHSAAGRVHVYLHSGTEGILLEVRDDGRGFDFDDIRADAFGLTGMRERVELLDGELSVLSRPGGPTVVTARLARWRPHDVDGPASQPAVALSENASTS